MISVGAPFDSCDWIIEPQAQLSYTNTSLDKFSKSSGDLDDRPRFHGMEADHFGSELSVKFAHPIRDGERSLFMPTLRLGWVADWGLQGDNQKVTFLESVSTCCTRINSDVDHVALWNSASFTPPTI